MAQIPTGMVTVFDITQEGCDGLTDASEYVSLFVKDQVFPWFYSVIINVWCLKIEEENWFLSLNFIEQLGCLEFM